MSELMVVVGVCSPLGLLYSSNTFYSNPGKDKIARSPPMKCYETLTYCRVLQNKLFYNISMKVSVASFPQSTNKMYKASLNRGLGSFSTLKLIFSEDSALCTELSTGPRAPGSHSFSSYRNMVVYHISSFLFLN